jgi:uncharacterized protein GlcG (DUF336 family)
VLTFGVGTGHSLSLLAKKTRALHLKKAARPERICYALSIRLLKWSYPMHVNSKDAETAIKAAVKKAQALKTQMCIAVVDSGANLKAFHRMDDAWVGSIDIAIKKAKTAVFFGMPTGQIGQLSQPAGPLFGIEHSNDGLITFPGGLPIVDEEGVLVGAIGVSGSTVENDNAVALAGVKTIGVSDLPAHPWRT